MSNVSTYNQLINRFKTWAEAHEQIKDFTFGPGDRVDNDKLPVYPFMHLFTNTVTYTSATKSMQVAVMFADMARKDENRELNEAEVLSDMQQVAEDLLATLYSDASDYFGYLVSIESPTLEPFFANLANTLTGWTLTFNVVMPYENDFCLIPSTIN